MGEAIKVGARGLTATAEAVRAVDELRQMDLSLAAMGAAWPQLGRQPQEEPTDVIDQAGLWGLRGAERQDRFVVADGSTPAFRFKRSFLGETVRGLSPYSSDRRGASGR